MRYALSPHDRRTLILGGAVMLTILLAGRVAPAALTLMHEEAATEDRIHLERARAVQELRALPEVRDSAQARRLRLGQEFPTLLHGRGDAALVAGLVAEVNEDASENAVFVSSIEAHSDTTHHLAYTLVNARADIIGDVRGIAGLLSTIESSDTRMRITEFALTQSDPAASPTQVELLHATVGIQAIGRAPNPPAGPSSHVLPGKVPSVATP